MGQQQLILLVLATVIVGIAIVVGIAAFTENSAKANADAMMQDAIRMANDVQAWQKKPVPFGGAGNLDYHEATFALLGYGSQLEEDDPAGAYRNLNGVFTLGGTAGNLIITGTGEDGQNQVEVHVCGPTQQNIAGAVRLIGGQAAAGAPTCNADLPGEGAGTE